MNPDDTRLLQPTPLLDFDHPAIEELVVARGWRTLAPFDRIGAIHDFVRDEIAFGYNADDALPASQVLADGIGQCNTKATLVMALLRSAGVPCRLHGFTIHKALQQGAIPVWAFALAPDRIVHAWAEAWLERRWVALEGVIVDTAYLHSLQRRFAGARAFSGYAVATPDLQAPAVQWCGSGTFIQREGIADDFGAFDSPDVFYARHAQALGPLQRGLFRAVVRHAMNRRVARIRAERW